MLARRYGSTSDEGELFDAAVDRYVEYVLLAELAVYFRAWAPCWTLSWSVYNGQGGSSWCGAAQGRHAPGRARRVYDLRLRARAYPGAGDAGEHTVASISLGRELPIELALLVVAVFANVSAIRRTFRIADLIREKKPAV
jgi:phosphatidylglycerophosphate synthase